MTNTINLIINRILLDALSPDRVDRIKVNIDLLEYLEEHGANDFVYTKTNKRKDNIVATYKGMKLVLSNLVTDYYEVVYKASYNIGQFVNVRSFTNRRQNNNLEEN
jgi:hypothetical protein